MPGPSLLGPRRTLAFGVLPGIDFRAAFYAIHPSTFAPLLTVSACDLAATGLTPGELLAPASTFPSPWGAEGSAITTGEQARAFVTAGYTRLSIDPSEYFVEKADTFSAEELTAASDALLEDGVFLPDWLTFRPEREITISETLTLRFTDDDLRRVAVKFGWSLAYFAELVAEVGGTALELEFSALAATRPTTPLEHWFIADECRRRGLPLTAFAPRLPGDWELTAEFPDDPAELASALAAHTAIAQACGPHQVSIVGIEEKHAILPALASACGDRLLVKAPSAGALALLRTIARTAPATFRELLVLAQEQFPFARTGHRISLNEDEIRFLPDVPDDALEATFLDHVQGRQLLLTTLPGLLANGSTVCTSLAAARTSHALQEEIAGAEWERLLTALRLITP